jgi:hypothetical protein
MGNTITVSGGFSQTAFMGNAGIFARDGKHVNEFIDDAAKSDTAGRLLPEQRIPIPLAYRTR